MHCSKLQSYSIISSARAITERLLSEPHFIER